MTKSDEIRALLAKRPDLSGSAIARRLGVCPSLVSRVKNNVNPLKVGPPISGFDVETVVRERMIDLKVSLKSLGQASGVHPERIRSFRNQQTKLTSVCLFALAEALGLRFYVEYMNVHEIPPRHPAHRLRTVGCGGRKPRSVWGAERPELPPFNPRNAAIQAYADATAASREAPSAREAGSAPR